MAYQRGISPLYIELIIGVCAVIEEFCSVAFGCQRTKLRSFCTKNRAELNIGKATPGGPVALEVLDSGLIVEADPHGCFVHASGRYRLTDTSSRQRVSVLRRPNHEYQ